MFERFVRDARFAVALAQEEARELGARSIGAEHLLLGLLRSAPTPLVELLARHGVTLDSVLERIAARTSGADQFAEDAAALQVIGIDLHAVRSQVDAVFGDDAFVGAGRRSGRQHRRRGHIPFSRPVRKALQWAARAGRPAGEVTSAHVLAGLLDEDVFESSGLGELLRVDDVAGLRADVLPQAALPS